MNLDLKPCFFHIQSWAMESSPGELTSPRQEWGDWTCTHFGWEDWPRRRMARRITCTMWYLLRKFQGLWVVYGQMSACCKWMFSVNRETASQSASCWSDVSCFLTRWSICEQGGNWPSIMYAFSRFYHNKKKDLPCSCLKNSGLWCWCRGWHNPSADFSTRRNGGYRSPNPCYQGMAEPAFLLDSRQKLHPEPV